MEEYKKYANDSTESSQTPDMGSYEDEYKKLFPKSRPFCKKKNKYTDKYIRWYNKEILKTPDGRKNPNIKDRYEVLLDVDIGKDKHTIVKKFNKLRDISNEYDIPYGVIKNISMGMYCEKYNNLTIKKLFEYKQREGKNIYTNNFFDILLKKEEKNFIKKLTSN